MVFKFIPVFEDILIIISNVIELLNDMIINNMIK